MQARVAQQCELEISAKVHDAWVSIGATAVHSQVLHLPWQNPRHTVKNNPISLLVLSGAGVVGLAYPSELTTSWAALALDLPALKERYRPL